MRDSRNYIPTDRDGRFEKIDRTELDSFIGDKVHVSWAFKGAVWILKEVKGNVAILETPRTEKIMRVKTSDLRKTRGY